MYIVTGKGSVIPLSNVKAVKPKAKGSVIYLKTGERINDLRSAEDVLKQAYQDKVEVAPLIDAITTISKCIQTHQEQVNKELAAVRNIVERATARVDESSGLLTSAAVKINSASGKALKTNDTMSGLVEKLNDAISEV
jgi:hypothetical protein